MHQLRVGGTYNYLLGITQIDETYECVSKVFAPVTESLKEMRAKSPALQRAAGAARAADDHPRLGRAWDHLLH